MRILHVLALLIVLTVAPPARAERVLADVPGAWGIAVDSKGDVFVSDSVSTIYEVTQSGAVSVVATGLEGPWGLAFDAADDLFIALFDDPNTVIAEIPAGTTTVQPFLPFDVSNPAAGAASGLTFDGQGNLFFASKPDGDIFEILRGTTTPLMIGEGFFDPIAIAVDAGGNIFVSRYSFDEIDRIPAGSVTPVLPNSGLVYASGLNGPTGLVFDSSGNLLVSIFGNGSLGTSVEVIPAGAPAPATPIPLVTGLIEPEYLAYRFGNLYIANSGAAGGQILTSAPPIPTLPPGALMLFGLIIAGSGYAAISRPKSP